MSNWDPCSLRIKLCLQIQTSAPMPELQWLIFVRDLTGRLAKQYFIWMSVIQWGLTCSEISYWGLHFDIVLVRHLPDIQVSAMVILANTPPPLPSTSSPHLHPPLVSATSDKWWNGRHEGTCLPHCVQEQLKWEIFFVWQPPMHVSKTNLTKIKHLSEGGGDDFSIRWNCVIVGGARNPVSYSGISLLWTLADCKVFSI